MEASGRKDRIVARTEHRTQGLTPAKPPDAVLPEGARVEIVIAAPDVTPELQAEFDAWDAASDEAWQKIDEWEEEQP